MHYSCTAELMELASIRFMVKMDDERLHQKWTNILKKLDQDKDGMMQLLYFFTAVCFRYNIQKLDDHLINALVNMLDVKHVATR